MIGSESVDKVLSAFSGLERGFDTTIVCIDKSSQGFVPIPEGYGIVKKEQR